MSVSTSTSFNQLGKGYAVANPPCEKAETLLVAIRGYAADNTGVYELADAMKKIDEKIGFDCVLKYNWRDSALNDHVRQTIRAGRLNNDCKNPFLTPNVEGIRKDVRDKIGDAEPKLFVVMGHSYGAWTALKLSDTTKSKILPTPHYIFTFDCINGFFKTKSLGKYAFQTRGMNFYQRNSPLSFIMCGSQSHSKNSSGNCLNFVPLKGIKKLKRFENFDVSIARNVVKRVDKGDGNENKIVCSPELRESSDGEEKLVQNMHTMVDDDNCVQTMVKKQCYQAIKNIHQSTS